MPRDNLAYYKAYGVMNDSYNHDIDSPIIL